MPSDRSEAVAAGVLASWVVHVFTVRRVACVVDAERTPEVNAEVLRRSRGVCEARVAPDCTMRVDHAHHIARRWHGSNEADNLLGCCFRCHGFLHDHPAMSYRLGFLKRSEALPPVVNTKRHYQ